MHVCTHRRRLAPIVERDFSGACNLLPEARALGSVTAAPLTDIVQWPMSGVWTHVLRMGKCSSTPKVQQTAELHWVPCPCTTNCLPYGIPW